MNEPADFISLLIAIVAIFATREVAHLVGPYAAIIVLACAGSGWALSGNEDGLTSGQKFWFVAFRVTLAVTLTVSAAELLEHFLPWAKPRYTLGPVALLISSIDDYRKARSRIIEWIARRSRDTK